MSATPTLQISATVTSPQLLPAGDGGYSLCFDLTGGQATFALDTAQVQALGLQCQHHSASAAPPQAEPMDDAAVRKAAGKIAQANDRALQLLMRETLSDDLIAFLWYMKDADLARRIFANLSVRAGEALFDDLDRHYGHLHPDTGPPEVLELARTATLKIVKTFDCLAAEGQIVHP